MTSASEHWLAPSRQKRLQGGAWVYRFFDDEDVLLYVGIAKDLPKRFQSHLRSLATPNWGNLEVVGFTAHWCPSRLQAELREAFAIAFEAPVYNGTRTGTRAGRALFAPHELGDREPARRLRIAARLGADPGKWAYVRHTLEGVDWEPLSVQVMRLTGRYCCRWDLCRWAGEFGEVTPVHSDSRMPTLAEVRPGAELLLSQLARVAA